MKSDGVTIINILTSHSNHQRQKIKRHYKILYSKVRMLTDKTFQSMEVKLHM
jgi:Annexin.